MKTKINIALYITVFTLTFLIFASGIYVSNYINSRKTNDLKAAEDQLSINLLSFETKVDLLKESSCDTFDKSSLDLELSDLAGKLNFMEDQLGKDNPELFRLKRYYSLLEIKDYLLTKKMSDKCQTKTPFVMYFYSNDDSCTTCYTQNYIFQAIKNRYPTISTYSFDYDLDLPTVTTLLSLQNIPDTPPVFSINGVLYSGFSSLSDIEAILDPLVQSQTATSTTSFASSTLKVHATSTKSSHE